MPQASILKPSRPGIHNAAPAEAPAFAPPYPFAMLSDRGRVRHANQDACGARPDCGAFAVCDGMGGTAGGEIASHMALETFLNALEESSTRRARRIPPKAASSASSHSLQNGASGYSQDAAGENPAQRTRARLEEAIQAANHAVYRHSQKSRNLRGMGTTLVALLLEDGARGSGDATLPLAEAAANAATATLWLAHVGDSRCYRLRGGVLQQITQDHSLVEEQIQAGLLSRVQAGSSPIRNIITRAIGSLPVVEPEIAGHPAQSGDLYLLASDGLTRELEDAEIAKILCATASHTMASPKPAVPGESGLRTALEIACHALVDAANAKGGGDNITVLLVAVQ